MSAAIGADRAAGDPPARMAGGPYLCTALMTDSAMASKDCGDVRGSETLDRLCGAGWSAAARVREPGMI